MCTFIYIIFALRHVWNHIHTYIHVYKSSFFAQATVEKLLPRFSSHDMNEMVVKKNALLSELSQCCVLLGVAEEKEAYLISQIKVNHSLTH